MREQFRRQRIRDPIGIAVLRQRGGLNQRPHVQLHGKVALVPQRLEAGEFRRQRVLQVVGQRLRRQRRDRGRGQCRAGQRDAGLILATGTGSDASPATMGYEGIISATDVWDARNS